MKIEPGKYYHTQSGEKVGPMEETDNGDPGGFWGLPHGLYRKDGTFGFGAECYCRELDLTSEWIEDETGTLAELDVKPGDVVEMVWNGILEEECSVTETIDEHGSFFGRADGMGHIFRIISRASDTTKTSSKSWPHNGEWSNWFMSGADGTIKNSIMRGKECEVETQKLAKCKQVAYRFRIKPEPVRETVTLYHGPNDRQAFTGYCRANDDVVITYTRTTTDGKPDLDSIKMEALG